jgi:hypothetical protein
VIVSEFIDEDTALAQAAGDWAGDPRGFVALPRTPEGASIARGVVACGTADALVVIVAVLGRVVPGFVAIGPPVIAGVAVAEEI